MRRASNVRHTPKPLSISLAVVSALLGSLLWSGAAVAQSAPVAEQNQAAQNATPTGNPAPAAAPAPDVQPDTQIEEIVITAQKRKEKLEDTPVAASVVSSDALKKANVSDVSDLNNLVPSLDLNGSFNGRVPMGIRGISSVSNEGTVGLSSGVAIMIDGVPVPSDAWLGNVMDDAASIEVLKGPQATLGGRTAAAGVINIVTNKASGKFGGFADATITTDKEYRLNGFITGPLSDKVDYSIFVYDDNKRFPIKNLADDQHSQQKEAGVRAKLALAATDDLDIQLALHNGVEDSSGGNFVYTYLVPGNEILTGPGGPPFLAQSVLLPGITVNQQNLNYASPVTAHSDVRDNDGTLNVDYRIGDLTFSSTTAYLDEQQENYQDLFAIDAFFWNELTAGSGAPAFYNTQSQLTNVRQISQEFKLASPTDRAFSYLVGAFFSNTEVDEHYDRTLLPAIYNAFVDSGTKTYDLYARTTWKFLPDTALITGLRFNSDKISYSINQLAYDAQFPPPTIYNDLTSSGSHSSTAFVGDLGLQHDFSADSMAYATYSRGYSPSAYNTAADLTPSSPAANYVPKETIDHFELGTKGTYLDRHMTANLDVFDTIYHDFQVQIFNQNTLAINPPLILTPAGKAQTRGLEADFVFQPSSLLRLNLGAAFVDAKFTDYRGAPCWYGQQNVDSGCTGHVNSLGGTVYTQDLTGKTMPNSPKVKIVLGADQRIPLEASFDAFVGGTYTYRDSVQMLVDQNPQAIQPSLSLVNLDAGLRSKSGNWTVTAFVNNLFNKVYYVDMEDFWSSVWANRDTVISEPARDAVRYGGLRVQWKFN